MTATTPLPASTPSVGVEERAARTHLFRRLLHNPVGLVSLVFLAIVVLSGIFAPLLAPADPNRASLQDVLAEPGAAHLLGADSAGRDVLSRLLFGTQFSLAGALVALAVAVVIGVTSGLLAGYFGGWFDSVSAWTSGLVMALPGFVVLLAARAVIGPSMWLSMAIFGVLLSPAFHRLVYASVTAVRGELFVDAARVSGLSNGRIIARHILTVVRAPVIIQASLVAGIAIAIQAGLEFLGLGDLSIPTWGSMLNDGFSNVFNAPILMLWPSLAIALTSIALTLLGNAMRDELERSASGAKRSKKRKSASAPATVPTSLSTIGIQTMLDEDAAAPKTVVHEEEAGAKSSEEILRVTNLSVGYGQNDGSVKTVVHDVSLAVRRGEIHGLIGESGSGKTQTAWSVLRLLPEGGRITGGSIVFDGKDLAHLSEKEMTKLRGKRIAYIPQEPMSNLDPSFTIGTQLVQPMRICLGLSKAAAKERALGLLARVGIPNPQRTFDAYPHEVSGGMAQRVLIAGAVSCDPDLLIADEPTTALDVTVQAEVLDLLRELQSELNMGMILVTHNFGVVADLCDRVSVMRDGRIVETGPVRSIFADPRHPYTRALFDAILEEGPARGPLVATTAVKESSR
ncbi:MULTISPECIES: dipeptide/oligopeptide/nickel ABC transporter permease/ATP-binding protein [unclassified Rathayibacter]|uniref:dipeptide/oligopeptide/nickel ABC transporter permease/ATP-binding protein n=1 Tax=unclassified Rathayibacter TaxID=2609250 RepID=UPI001046D66C|nr:MULTISPECIES: dipeptide/oligopeptide/nickel ABC transporter permease/ATP-binding protein [unclassified Rathayibacter]MCJ1671885.1 dipeptide/oligopeptide/nickel ABC transporter permease/ATP-binding protein [Rathayibacter sp. VKM Ac-2929]MCJ1683945.1 dipeptide/oligopeptide/nickel ABC transporter permease/ATP-binding protein [Rathayibacter sp. VKM Ac-2928]TCL81649.1 ABC-type dipeptide/oligopeptide/nickel transport system ATPase component [Rathayibacter sp. PhB192]TCM26658.1 ABC-type dipeptide/o